MAGTRLEFGLGRATGPLEVKSNGLKNGGNGLSANESRDEKMPIPWAHLRIPPFPQVAIRVMQLADKENVQLHQLSELILSDPAFASEVLTIANSLLYAPRFPASSILQAIAVMGANHLQGMCLTVGARTYLGKAMNDPSIRGLWRHNVACALIAEQLASVGFMEKEIAYTSGVLHDIGRLALAAIRPKEYAALLGSHRGPSSSLLEGERELFGWDHCQVGKRLIVEWKLPADFEAVVSEHHAPRLEDGTWGMGELIKLSCRMADTAGFAAFPGCELTAYPVLLEQLPARERRLFHPEVETLAFEVGSKIQSLEAL